MNETINTVVPLMSALIQKPGLASSSEQISEAAGNLMALMSETSNKVLKVFAQDDPKHLATINRILALLVAESWQNSKVDGDTAEKISQVFIAVIDNIDIDLDQAFDLDQHSIAVGIDTAGWITKCLPPIIELWELDPEKSGRGKLFLGQKSYEENIVFIQKKVTERVEQLTEKMMVKDTEADRSIGMAVSDLFSVILQSQFNLLVAKADAAVTTDDQKEFLKEKAKYPEGILIEKSLKHLNAILKICFPGTYEG